MNSEERPSVLSDAWRQSLVLSAMGEKCVESIPKWSLPRSDWVEGAAKVGVHPSGGMCVLGTANGRSANSLGFISLAQSNLKTHTRVTTAGLPFQSTAMLWTPKDHLFVGSSEGRVAMWPSLAPESEVVRNFDFSKPKNVFTASKMKDSRTASVAPGDWAYSSCITSLGVTATGGSLVGSETSRLHIWDIETETAKKQTTQPIRVSSGTVLCLSTSPVSDSVIALGSATSGAKVLDVRGKKESVWKTSATTNAVRCIAMSPLVEHWLMTGTDGGSIKIWDMRATGSVGPLLSFNHYQAILTGLFWDPLHAELLASSGVDGTMRVYSLRHPPEYGVATARNKAPSVGMAFVASNEARMSCSVMASSSGEVTTLALSPIFIDTLGDHKLRDISQEAEACDRLAYLRHLKEAEQKIRASIASYMDRNETEEAMMLASLLHKHEPEEPASMSSHAALVAAFKKDVLGCCRKLPPLYPYRPSMMLSNLELNLTFAHYANEKKWEEIVIKVHEMDTEDVLIALQPAVYTTVVKALARHAWVVGCDFYLKTYKSVDMDEEDMKELALFLTGEMLTDGDRALNILIEELEQLRAITGLLTVENGAEKIVAECCVIDSVQCAATIRLYCSALMQEQQIAKVVWLVDYLQSVYSSSPAIEALQQLISGLVTRYEIKLEREKAKMDADMQLQGRQFIQALHNVLTFAVEMAVACRKMVYEYHANMYLHMPKEGTCLDTMLNLTSKCAEEMRTVVSRIFRQEASAGAAVQQECDTTVQRAVTELSNAIDSSKLDTRGLNNSHIKYVKHCEALLSSFKSSLSNRD
eukprot:TRINITY_DN21194_c0_g1_i1.p1 TRINITY_DN21194_c0_g1~~TRINITY_DN21194_c0_g1_i1.p1  ORF type:complete len:812 (+),score=191.81 TRINITY_DN21194_c0_g1_i1:51-2486(+)